MNFFEHQDRARRKTLQLVALFILAMISLALTLTLALAALIYFQTPAAAQQDLPALLEEYTPLLAGITLVVFVIVFLGAFFRRMQLSGGGRSVAESLGGRLLNTATSDPLEQRLLNTVEEMALASGIAVPPVYLLDEPGINAFAAGFNPQDAVIGVTRGAVEQLNRDELQGVIAHEFSHILHGDMRLNIRLVAWLYGILLLGLIGRMLLNSLRYRRVRSSRDDKSTPVILALGLGLLIIGYAGSFFGSLIKAAVSRQREFLADASAVQYTRNPQGIGGALRKLAGYPQGSALQSGAAEEYSHMFFGNARFSGLSQLFSTHPPLDERIARVDPQGRAARQTPRSSSAGTSDTAGLAGVAGLAPLSAPLNAQQASQTAMQHIGDPDGRHLTYIRQLLQELDQELQQAAHEPFSARALIYGLLLSQQAEIRSQQLEALQNTAHPDTFKVLQQYQTRLIQLDPRLRLPLIELSLPALKQLSETQYQTFKACIDLLIRADKRISLFEWSLRKILLRHLEPQPQGKSRFRLNHCQDEIQRLLSLLAEAGHSDPQAAQAAYAEALASLPLQASATTPARPGLKQLEQDLNKLLRLRPLEKPALLNALVICASHDGQITATEAELLRAIADCIDCPLPPLLPH